MLIEIKNRFTGNVIFAHEQENNSIAITIKLAFELKTNLSDADLSDANLRGADLRGANGNMKEIKSMRLNKWAISFTAEVMAIGCQQHSIEDWKGFDDSKINCMGSSALEWWKKWKDFIFKAIELANT